MPDSATTQPQAPAAASTANMTSAIPVGITEQQVKDMPFDERADLSRRAEYWKGVLNENPMSPEFIEAHDDLSLLIPEDIDSQARTLALMEKQIEEGAEDARRFLDDSTVFDQPGQRPLKQLLEAFYQVDQHGIIIDDGPSFAEMIQSDKVTIGELIDRYRNYNQRLAKKFLNGSHKRAAILNSVRTGEASRSLMPPSARPDSDTRTQYELQQKPNQ